MREIYLSDHDLLVTLEMIGSKEIGLYLEWSVFFPKLHGVLTSYRFQIYPLILQVTRVGHWINCFKLSIVQNITLFSIVTCKFRANCVIFMNNIFINLVHTFVKISKTICFFGTCINRKILFRISKKLFW